MPGQVQNDDGPAGGAPPEETWAAFNAERFLALAVRVISDDRLRATGATSATSRMRMIHLRANAHVVERSSELIRRDPVDGLMIGMVLGGGVNIAYHGGAAQIAPGEVTVVRLDQPFLAVFDDDTEAIAVLLGRALFAEASGGAVPTGLLTPMPGGTPSAAAFRDTVLRTTGAGGPAVTDAEVVDVVGGLLRGDESSRTYAAAARRYIDATIVDPALGAARIAQAIGISERHLSRVFADTGVSVPEYVRIRRLERAEKLIAAAHARTTVADVSRSCGFSSPGTFSRAFTAHFGVHPSEALRRVVAGQTGAD